MTCNYNIVEPNNSHLYYFININSKIISKDMLLYCNHLLEKGKKKKKRLPGQCQCISKNEIKNLKLQIYPPPTKKKRKKKKNYRL